MNGNTPPGLKSPVRRRRIDTFGTIGTDTRTVKTVRINDYSRPTDTVASRCILAGDRPATNPRSPEETMHQFTPIPKEHIAFGRVDREVVGA